MSDLLWALGFLWLVSFMGVGAWWAWYALVRANQRTRHARAIQLAARQGLPVPEPPPPPNVLRFMLGLGCGGALLAIIGVGFALWTVAFDTSATR